MEIYWVLFYENPQQLQSLADYDWARYGQKISKPPPPEAREVFDHFNTEQAGKEMRRKPQHQVRVR